MTAIQVCALIGIVLGAALIYWTGYRGGLTDGRLNGFDEGKNTERANSAKSISDLKTSLVLIRNDKKYMDQFCQKLKTSQMLSPDNHQTLLAIAETLRLAADTFTALNSHTKATRALVLHQKALSMAALLESLSQEDAA